MGNKNLLHESLFFAWTEPQTGRQKVTQYKKSDPVCQAKNPIGKHTEFCDYYDSECGVRNVLIGGRIPVMISHD